MEQLDQYLQECEYRGIAPSTLRQRRIVLAMFLEAMAKPLEQVTREEVLAWLASQGLASTTQRQYRQVINQFLRFLGFPVKLPPMKVREKLLSNKDLVTEEEVWQLVHGAGNTRDRALLLLTYETGGRAHEILSLTLQDVVFEPNLAMVRIRRSKSKPRNLPIFLAIPYLQEWLNVARVPIPQPDGTLKYRKLNATENIWQGKCGPISYPRLYQIVTLLSQRILGRQISPHYLRHSRATHLSENKEWTEAEIKEYFGWGQGSSVIQRYVKISGKALKDATLRMHGKLDAEQPVPSPLQPKTCARCHYENPADGNLCTQCGLVLDKTEALHIIQRNQEVEQFLRFLVEKRPELVRKLAQEMRNEQDES